MMLRISVALASQKILMFYSCADSFLFLHPKLVTVGVRVVPSQSKQKYNHFDRISWLYQRQKHRVEGERMRKS